MSIDELYSLFLKHPLVTIDSRNCPPGSLFFALKGERFDGHDFVEQALQSGSAYAIVDDVSRAYGKQVVIVDNVLSALQHLARMHRQALGIPVIGITGTNGKTTTKELTAAVLSQKYNLLYTLGNLNNHIGVPLTLLRLTDQHEMAVIEMGANHPGEIAELAAVACPDYGLITNVGYAHLEGFGSLEGVIKTKGELYDYLRMTHGTVFIHRDNEYLTAIAGGLRQVRYGALNPAEEHGQVANGVADMAERSNQMSTSATDLVGRWNTDKNDTPSIAGRTTYLYPCLSFSWQNNRQTIYTVNTHLVGGYNLWNVLAAITIGVYFDVPNEMINEAISQYKPTNNRSQLKKTQYNELIIDAYNANPSSMRAALENFAAHPTGLLRSATNDEMTLRDAGDNPDLTADLPKAVILGDMLELGEKSDELHKAIIQQIETMNFEKVLLCGAHFPDAGKQYTCFPTVEQLNEYLEANSLRGYAVLIKGSRAIHLEKTIEFL